MCLTPKRKYRRAFNHQKAIVTDKDIICYKYLDKSIEKNCLTAPFHNQQYEVGKVYETELGWHKYKKPRRHRFSIFPLGYNLYIEEGFHALLDPDNKNYIHLIACHNLYKVIIPKGSTIVEGKIGDIVSNRIIVTDEEVWNSKGNKTVTTVTVSDDGTLILTS